MTLTHGGLRTAGEIMKSVAVRPSVKRLAVFVVLCVLGMALAGFGVQAQSSQLPSPQQQSALGNPTNLQATPAGAGQVNVTWQPAQNADFHYVWSVKPDGSGGKWNPAGATDGAITVTGLEGGQLYWFIALAGEHVNGVRQWSQYSNWASATVAAGTSDDRTVLVALYNATGGANWTDNTNWLSTSPIGEWHGVTTDASGRVTELDLRDNQLSGQIPPALSNLSDLTWLVLSRNRLTGQIPSQLGNLSNLEVLALGGNELTGPIPSSLSGLSRLAIMNLWSNQLSGSVPSWLGNLANLESIHLADNQLTGQIPPSLGNLAHLTRLRLQENQLNGAIPSQLGNLSELERLELHDNQLSGRVPATLGNLSSLERLDLRDNELTGAIPAQLGNLPNLTLLNLGDNELTGPIPSQL